MTKKKSYLKKIVICLLTLILVCSAGFYIYASDYYHAKDYEVSNVDIKQQDNYMEIPIAKQDLYFILEGR